MTEYVFIEVVNLTQRIAVLGDGEIVPIVNMLAGDGSFTDDVEDCVTGVVEVTGGFATFEMEDFAPMVLN